MVALYYVAQYNTTKKGSCKVAGVAALAINRGMTEESVLRIVTFLPFYEYEYELG
jgi:hypothetical protein